MLTFQFGLDSVTRALLTDCGFGLMATDPIGSEEDVLVWVEELEPQLIIMDLTRRPWAISAAHVLRKRGLKTPILAIFSDQPAATDDQHEWWCKRQEELLKNDVMTFVLRGPIPASIILASAKMIRGLASIAEKKPRAYRVNGVEIEYDVDSKTVLVNGDGIRLRRSASRLFGALFASMGRPLSKERLMRELYFDRPSCDWPEPKILDVLICQARRKLSNAHPALDGLIETVWGCGYTIRRLQLVADESDASQRVSTQKVA